MKEELIRLEHGCVQYAMEEYCFDFSICRGEVVGIYVDDHFTSGSACYGVFSGEAAIKEGRGFAEGNRMQLLDLSRWIRTNSQILSKYRFESKELTALDYITALGKNRKKRNIKKLLETELADRMVKRMGLTFDWNMPLTGLSRLEYYKIAILKAWLEERKILILDRMTEILGSQELDELMDCIFLLLQNGTAVFILDMNEEFMYRYANRIDVIRNRMTCYRLDPEEYDGRLFEILGWDMNKKEGTSQEQMEEQKKGLVLSAEKLKFQGIPEMTLEVRRGEILFLKDESHIVAERLKECFLGKQDWESGSFVFENRELNYKESRHLVGQKIGIQVEMPDRTGGVLFQNMTAVDNLALCLVPKAKKHIIHKNIRQNILKEAKRWFDEDKLLQPIGTWPLSERLRLVYYRWVLINPRLLVCLFPFAGQEAAYHEMIIDLLVTCAKRGMGILLVSSNIDSICEKTDNMEFLERMKIV